MLGPAAPALGWVPAPRYLLRRQRILPALEGISPGPVLEIGPGAGMLLQELHARGFQCHALETSAEARDLIHQLCVASDRAIQVHAVASEHWRERFPLVMAFEVLEHIEDDAGALAQWARWLAPGGTLLLSVPAHPRQWNAADVWAGHYRRYERRGLVERVTASGLRVEHVECIGFPLGNLTERLQARGFQRRIDATGETGAREANNDRSGIDRSALLKWYPLLRSWPGRLALRGAFAVQWATRGLPFGNGYLLGARKPA
ncbi:class I SAM-dependent methyltransferase [Marilutibacter aestuarii]|nr:class I SAM-dependent methyltransferase [Lysobacter aestuarii]